MEKTVKNVFFLFSVFLVSVSCVTVSPPPEMPEKTQTAPRYYTFTVLIAPKELGNSPRLEIALSLMRPDYTKVRNDYLNNLLYSTDSVESYKDRVVEEQREKSRNLAATINSSERYDMRYAEKINVINAHEDGVVIERTHETYLGGAHGMETIQYYVVDLGGLRQVRVDDIFGNFQGDDVRRLVYAELRKSNGFRRNQPLSQGIFDKDEPELSFNFFLTQEGFGLHWDPYQIAPYSAGSIEIILPWDSIRPLMLHSGIGLLAKFGVYFPEG
jgi:hypothetical protein